VATLTIEQPNAPPSVSLTAPATGAVVGTGQPLSITASASDLEGIDRVEFYRGSVLLGTDTVAPYAHTWASPTNGSYTLTAKAFDVLGLSTTSAPVPITVQPVATVSVAPVSPTAGSAAVLTIDGASFCTAVRIYFGDGQETTLLDDGGLPMTTSYAWATAGPKTITAMGLGGACESQAQKSISVLTPPTVSMTSPATGTIFSPPATIGLAASATAAQGTISKVEFFANGTLLTTDTTAPYSYSWPSVPEGTYALTARATDTMGAVATSSSVTAIVGNPPPSTVLGVSVSQAVAGQPATVTVVGTNPCAWVWLEFGDGDWWLGPIGSLPFNTSKTWASSGTYTVLARGWDTCLGEVTTQVTVSSGAPAEVLASVEIPNADARRGLTETRAGMSGSEPEWLDHDGWAEEAVELPDGSVLPAAPERARTLPAALHLEPAAPAVTIHVDVNGTGSGTVSGSVSCSGSSTTCPAQFNPGQGVTLTASAAPGSVFTGWTGVCATTGSACGFGAVDGLVVIANFQSTSTPVTKYYHLDTLGSVRALTDASGAVLERHDYRPFGEDTMPLPAPGSDPARFLGQQRDSTQLDYFGARYYSMFHGRFTGVDPVINPSAIVNPQRWNRYAYSQNNPLRFVDPTGLDFVEDTNPIMDPDYICSAICQENESNWDALRELDWWWQFEEFRAERQGSEGAQLSVNDIINQLPPGTAAAVATAVTQAIIPYILAGALPGMPTIIPGGYRETGFDIHRAADGSFFFAQYVPGPDVFPFPGQTSYGQLTPYRPTFADPNIGIRITGLAFAAAHVHPANYPIPPWSAGPSDDDRKRLSQGAIGIIISPNNNRIYFYGSRVRRGTQDMSLGDFYRRAK
jgi:RHS repeat-associated protein